MADNLEVRRATTSISVEIYDQTYHLRAHDQVYIQKLASMVDAKMRAVSASGNTVDSLRVAVLAALNIADEFLRLQENCSELRGSVTETQSSLRTRA
ncbi:MAG TPA: cell division protein ZapA, partial [Acidobacteriaceae bacterium]|nr:cell division protein ZapA [Acidobacteriaceae bacterium]